MSRLYAILVAFLSASCAAADNFYLHELIPHTEVVEFGHSALLKDRGRPVGLVVGYETVVPYVPELPKRDEVTSICYGLHPDENRTLFTVTDPAEIDLIYRIFEKFSSLRLVEKRYYTIAEEGEVTDVKPQEPQYEPDFGHLCTNGYYFFAGHEILLKVDSHPKDEEFWGKKRHFVNHAMVAFIDDRLKMSEPDEGGNSE